VTDLHCPARVYLARHGEAEYESDLLGDVGGSLTQAGRAESRDLADSLRGQSIARVWSSPLARAVQTAEIVAARLGVDVVIREALQEYGVGDWAGQDFESARFDDVFRDWVDGRLDRRIPGAESGEEIVARFSGVLRAIADEHRGEGVLVVSHGGVMLTALPPLLGLPYPDGVPTLPNCGVIEAEADADGWRVVSWCGERV
jgi:2,3-bisphosphoglycerate-dependent phosphoglycerate mutase